jgi:hypothetical protein
MAQTATFKRGSTFGCTGTYDPGTGPATLADVTIQSDIIDSAYCTYSLTIVKDVDNLGFSMTYVGDTGSWNTGLAKWDLKFTYGGSVFYSETLRLNIIDQVTD